MKMKRIKKLLKRPARRKLVHLSRRDGFMLCIGVGLALVALVIGKEMQVQPTPLAATGGITIPWVPASVKQWQQPITQMAQKYDIDPNLLAIIMTMESGGYAKADSGQAQGLMQITPPTAQDIASKYLKKPVASYNIWDPKTNIEFGAAYLAHLRDVFGTSDQAPSWNVTVELIAAGYNGGPGAASSLEKGDGLHDVQTVSYSRDAYNMWRERHASNSPTFDRWKERGGIDLLQKAQNP
ncbi:MAG TPA: transglycosylase SLT domain-containing protein [Candidatus Saccharimonadales bacterium]|nr:transglycosylase SLT domain-containing protein [Candidatus Saccharimonadales bacterium]